MTKSILFLLILFFLVLNCLLSTQAQISRDIRENVIEAVVQIIPYNNNYGLLEGQSGSGTVISTDGYILTNFHVIGNYQTGEYYNYHKVYNVKANQTDLPPQFSYWAKFVAGDSKRDLALLKIYQDSEGKTTKDDFSALLVGNANELLPGDFLTIVGYPDISGTTITFTAGLMSGWLGEDFTAGGKNWIKTDGKITYGNSGGAALNDQGELIGIPTILRKVHYEEKDITEQAYLRPINLAWPIIAINITNSQFTQSVTEPERAEFDFSELIIAKTAIPNRIPEAKAYGSGAYGEITVGEKVTSVIDIGNEEATFHTYTIKVPQGLEKLTISVDGKGRDVDMAVQRGSKINNYEKADYLDTTEDSFPHYTYENPPTGIISVDVINLLELPIAYTLAVSKYSFHNAQNMQQAQPSGSYGYIAFNKDIKGIINPSKNLDYHSYLIDIPEGLKSFVVMLNSQHDLDIALKFGEKITNYADKLSGGDWDYRDLSSKTKTRIHIDKPQAGRWYIDVLNTFDSQEELLYTLQVSEP